MCCLAGHVRSLVGRGGPVRLYPKSWLGARACGRRQGSAVARVGLPSEPDSNPSHGVAQAQDYSRRSDGGDRAEHDGIRVSLPESTLGYEVRVAVPWAGGPGARPLRVAALG